MMNFALKTRNCVSKTRDFAFKNDEFYRYCGDAIHAVRWHSKLQDSSADMHAANRSDAGRDRVLLREVGAKVNSCLKR